MQRMLLARPGWLHVVATRNLQGRARTSYLGTCRVVTPAVRLCSRRTGPRVGKLQLAEVAWRNMCGRRRRAIGGVVAAALAMVVLVMGGWRDMLGAVGPQTRESTHLQVVTAPVFHVDRSWLKTEMLLNMFWHSASMGQWWR